MGILAAAAFAVLSTYHQTKQKSPGQIVCWQETILPIIHIEIWRYICQRKHAHIEKDVIREISTRINYDFNTGDKVLVRKNQAYKYETPFQIPYENFQTWTNGTVNIQKGAVTDRLNIRCIKPYDSPEIE